MKYKKKCGCGKPIESRIGTKCAACVATDSRKDLVKRDQ